MNLLMIRMKERRSEAEYSLKLLVIRVLHEYELIAFLALGSNFNQEFGLGSKEA